VTLNINLFAGPGAGKSTTAAGLFYAMKKKGMSVELVTEYAKDRVWEEHHSVFQDQLYITAKQNRRLKRLQGKVDYIVTDSPILLGQYYSNWELTEQITNVLHAGYKNLNIFINRTKPYVEEGRNETYEEALKADEGIKKILEGRKYYEMRVDEDLIPNILKLMEIQNG
jgi:tRNA uridine 5-carbamoylmethylation protein Kti12